MAIERHVTLRCRQAQEEAAEVITFGDPQRSSQSRAMRLDCRVLESEAQVFEEESVEVIVSEQRDKELEDLEHFLRSYGYLPPERHGVMIAALAKWFHVNQSQRQTA